MDLLALVLLFFKLLFSLVTWIFVPIYVGKQVTMYAERLEGWVSPWLKVLGGLYVFLSIVSDLFNLIEPSWRGLLGFPLLVSYLSGAGLLNLSVGALMFRMGWTRRKQAKDAISRTISEGELLVGLGLLLKGGVYGLLLLQVVFVREGLEFIPYRTVVGSFVIETFPKEEGVLGFMLRRLSDVAYGLIHYPGILLFIERFSYKTGESSPLG